MLAYKARPFTHDFNLQAMTMRNARNKGGAEAEGRERPCLAKKRDYDEAQVGLQRQRATNLDVNVMTMSHWVGADAVTVADSLGLNDDAVAVAVAAVQQQRCPSADPNLH